MLRILFMGSGSMPYIDINKYKKKYIYSTHICLCVGVVEILVV